MIGGRAEREGRSALRSPAATPLIAQMNGLVLSSEWRRDGRQSRVPRVRDAARARERAPMPLAGGGPFRSKPAKKPRPAR